MILSSQRLDLLISHKTPYGSLATARGEKTTLTRKNLRDMWQAIYVAQEMGKSMGRSEVLQRKVQEKLGKFLLLYFLLNSPPIKNLLNEFK